MAAFWRSDLALDVLHAQIEGLKHLAATSGYLELLGLIPGSTVDLKAHVAKLYQEIDTGLATFKREGRYLPLKDIVSEAAQRDLFLTIAARINHLTAGFARNFMVAADLPLGFNAADGD